MIVGLLIATFSLALLSWLTLMFMWWQKEKNAQEPLAADVAVTYFDKCARLVRRGWYFCERYAQIASSWSNKKMQKVFFSLFPNAAPAFAKRDALAGLSHGPSSFFLMSISETAKEAVKKSSARKKIA